MGPSLCHVYRMGFTNQLHFHDDLQLRVGIKIEYELMDYR